MTDIVSAAPSDPARGDVPKELPKRLGFWSTLGWGLLVFAVTQAVGIIALGVWNVAHGAEPLAISGFDGAQIALTTLVINVLQVALLVEIPRWRIGANPFDYLALTRFSLGNLLIGVIAIIVVVAALDGISHFVRSDTVTPFETDIFTSGRAEGWLTAVIVAVVLVGPIGEEVLFRGFLFRGWVTPDWRGVIAAVAIPVLWSAMHLQYDWFGMSQVFLIGLVLSWLRWRSGSCLLTIALHVLVNLVGMVEVALKVGWPGT